MFPFFYYLQLLSYYVIDTSQPSGLRMLNARMLTTLQLHQHMGYAFVASIQTIVYLLFVLASISMIFFVGGVCLTKTRFLRRTVLTDVQSTEQGYTSPTYSSKLVGAQGIAQTPLHPSGKVTICGICYDVKTLGSYIPSGANVIVISVAGSSLTVAAV